MGNYALVKIINSVETVDNIIVASPEVAATYLVANSGDYDYALDVSLYSPEPEMGYIYDPGENTFSAPSNPEDYAEEVELAIVDLHETLMFILDKSSNISSLQLGNAIAQALSAIEPEYTATELDLFSAISDYINNGG